jgi:hypothetical protein
MVSGGTAEAVEVPDSKQYSSPFRFPQCLRDSWKVIQLKVVDPSVEPWFPRDCRPAVEHWCSLTAMVQVRHQIRKDCVRNWFLGLTRIGHWGSHESRRTLSLRQGSSVTLEKQPDQQHGHHGRGRIALQASIPQTMCRLYPSVRE